MILSTWGIIWGVISLVLNVGLVVWAVYERILAQRDKDYIKASVRVWQHQAQGIASAISTLASAAGAGFAWTKFSKAQDVGIALNSVHAIAESMSQSLYESRFFTDEELKENIKKDKENAEARAVVKTLKHKKREKRKIDSNPLSS